MKKTKVKYIKCTLFKLGLKLTHTIYLINWTEFLIYKLVGGRQKRGGRVLILWEMEPTP